MNSKQWLVLSALVGVWTAFRFDTQLPDRVAMQFDAVGRPISWGSATALHWTLIGVYLGLAALFLALPYLMRITPGRWTNLPHREYWLAPERKQATVNRMGGYLYVMGVMLNGFLMGLHGLIVKAQHSEPVRLPGREFALLMVVFFVLVGAWTAYWLWRFRLPEGEG